MLKRPKKKRRISIIITFVDFVIVFIFIFYYANRFPVAKIKTVQHNDYVIKYRYDRSADKTAYLFALNITNKAKKSKTIELSKEIKFYIKNKKDKKVFWEKVVIKPDYPVNLSGKKKIIVKPGEFLGYNCNYKMYKKLPEGIWIFGSKINFGTNNIYIEIIKNTKPRKGFLGLLRG